MDAALVISGISLVVAVLALVLNELRWRAERRRDVEVAAWHDGAGMDHYADRTESEQIIAVRVFNHGERSEHVMWLGAESANGEPLADDRPKAPKIVDEPAPEGRELPPRGQVGVQFHVPTAAIADGFVGYAVLGTGERIYSPPAAPDPNLGEVQRMVQEKVRELGLGGEEPLA